MRCAQLTRRLRQFFHQRKHVMMAKSASSVINKMSTSLQIEVVMIVHQHWLQHIWFLRGAEPACLVQLALRMEPCVFAPSELPEPTHLYIIHRTRRDAERRSGPLVVGRSGGALKVWRVRSASCRPQAAL